MEKYKKKNEVNAFKRIFYNFLNFYWYSLNSNYSNTYFDKKKNCFSFAYRFYVTGHITNDMILSDIMKVAIENNINLDGIEIIPKISRHVKEKNKDIVAKWGEFYTDFKIVINTK